MNILCNSNITNFIGYRSSIKRFSAFWVVRIARAQPYRFKKDFAKTIESSFEGDLDLHGFLGMDESVRNGYENINVIFKIKAAAPKEKLQELVELAQKRSPVFDIVTNKVPVSVQLAK